MNDEQLRGFFEFMYERQEIYVKRRLHDHPYPWSRDPILCEYHFCNIYREQDAGTKFLLENIIDQVDNRDVLFNVIFYRFLNRPDSYQAAGGFTHADDFHPDQVVERLHEFHEENPVFSPAYRVVTHGDFETKVENIVYEIMRDDVLEYLHEYMSGLSHSEYMEECFNILKQIHGVGDFLAYEILTDLNYGWLPYNENQFVNIGPGAAKGLEAIFDRVDKRDIYWMVLNQDWLFKKFDLDFYYWNGTMPKTLTLRSIEHSLCEYSKYLRAHYDPSNLRKFHLHDEHGQEQIDIFNYHGECELVKDEDEEE